jgi:hypothetical protein
VRDAAARSQCQNNLKSIAHATIHYAEQNKEHLPMASYSDPERSGSERLGWLVAILPQMGQEVLFSQFDITLGWDTDTNRRAANRPLKELVCPAQDTTKLSSPLPTTTYPGVAGVGVDAALLPMGERNCGVFGHERRIRVKDVSDGPAQTLLILETSADLGPWSAAGTSTVRGIDPSVAKLIGEDRAYGRVHRMEKRRFAHVGEGAQAALLDGSARYINATVSVSTVAAAATIAGEDTLGPDW